MHRRCVRHHQALRDVTLVEGDFTQTTQAAGRGDAVYFDPPYVPLSTSSSFTGYHRSSFGPDEQERLLDVYLDCCQRGATAVLSNSDCPYTRELYRGLIIKTVRASRAINSVASKRGQINEVLVVGRKVNRSRLAAPVDSAVSRGARQGRTSAVSLIPVCHVVGKRVAGDQDLRPRAFGPAE